MNEERWATIIKIAAVAVTAPRWIGALLEAEGVPLPSDKYSRWTTVRIRTLQKKWRGQR